MTELVHEKLARGTARIVDAPIADVAEPAIRIAPRHQVDTDRNFELPTALFGATVAAYLAFLGVMFAAFSGPMLAIPMVIFALFIVAGFGVPAIWCRLKDNSSRPLDMLSFQRLGIQTNTGPCTARDAAIQMLILPVLIVGWGIAITIIVATVS